MSTLVGTWACSPMLHHMIPHLLAVSFILAMAPTMLIAATITSSTTGGDWGSASTWLGGSVPGSGDDVIIDGTVTLDANTALLASVTINAGKTLRNNGAEHVISLAGGWTNNGTFSPGAFITVVFCGSGSMTLTGTTPFHRLRLMNTVTLSLQSSITVTDSLSIMSGTRMNAGSAIITLNGTVSPAMQVSGSFRCETSTVVHAVDGAQTIAPLEYFNLETQGAGTKTLAGRTTIHGIVTIGPGSTLAAGSSTLVLAGTTDPTPMTVNGTFDPGTSTVRYVADINQNVVPVDYHTLYLGRPDGGSTTRERYAAGSFSVYGDLVTDTNATFTVYQHTISIQRDVRPTHIGSTASVRAGRNVWRRGATLRFFGAGSSVLLQNAAAPAEADVNHLLLEKDTPQDTVVIGNRGTSGVLLSLRDSGDVTITRGVLDLQGNFMTPIPVGTSLGVFTLGSEGTLRCGGYDNFPPNDASSGNPPTHFADYALQTGSNVEYYRAGAQVVRANASSGNALQYSNIRLMGSGKKSMQRNTSTVNMIVNDTLTLQSGCSFGRMHTRTALRFAGTGVLQYKHNDAPALQALQIMSDSEYVTGTYAPQNLSIYNTRDVKFQIATSNKGGDHSKTLSGTLQFIRGKLILGRNDLTMSSSTYPIVGGDSARFVVCDTSNAISTNNAGWLSLACVNTTEYTTFPIGTIYSSSGPTWGVDTSYNPVFIRTLQYATTLQARVSRFITRPLTNPEILVYREWSVEEAGSASNDAEVICSWNLTDEGTEFVRPNAQLITYHNTGRDEYQVPSAIGTWPVTDLVGPWFVQGRLDAPSNKTKFKNNLRINIGSSGIFPVQLVAFSASKVGGAVRLEWRTASEYLNVGFDIERSWNGSTWNRIGRVAGQGTKTTPTDYAWTDEGLTIYHGPTVWYRLRQRDVRDGVHHSPVMRVELGSVPDDVSIEDVYPNPARNSASIVLGIPQEQRVSISIVDALGREVRRIRDGETLATGTHLMETMVADIPAGVYFLRVAHAGGTELKLLVISR